MPGGNSPGNYLMLYAFEYMYGRMYSSMVIYRDDYPPRNLGFASLSGFEIFRTGTKNIKKNISTDKLKNKNFRHLSKKNFRLRDLDPSETLRRNIDVLALFS